MRRTPRSSFGNDITNTANNNGNNYGDDDPLQVPPHIARIGGIGMFPHAGRGVIKVVGRCEDALENSKLDLSECQLMQVPDAVYHLLRNTPLKTCNLSGNVIKKIPSKFATNFSLITDLNLSHNQIAKLPNELAELASLASLNISHNSFIVLPPVVFKIPKLRELDASHNAIIEINTDHMITSDSLEVVDLRHNPLGRSCHRQLENANTPFRLEISEYNEDEDC